MECVMILVTSPPSLAVRPVPRRRLKTKLLYSVHIWLRLANSYSVFVDTNCFCAITISVHFLVFFLYAPMKYSFT